MNEQPGTASAQLVEDRADQQVATGTVDGDRHQPTDQFPNMVAFECRQREALEQQQGMLAAGLGAFRIGTEGARIGTHLIGDEPDQGQWRILADTQETSWTSAQTELNSEAESILLTAPLPHQR